MKHMRNCTDYRSFPEPIAVIHQNSVGLDPARRTIYAVPKEQEYNCGIFNFKLNEDMLRLNKKKETLYFPKEKFLTLFREWVFLKQKSGMPSNNWEILSIWILYSLC